ncbi:hypothetical protein [Pelagibaculum spongiae]|uniref:Uncharacterized protein n=1 Tax=Pelagibaculum spongiae TaxID=2080658 RepID=A0A2V1H1R2_9GAMM|nr:hypothetical protein [Pelagibaculum spongiae]PVZ70372.1 hypothetical protein DC094_07195 [Pelagibaculum spongiae]
MNLASEKPAICFSMINCAATELPQLHLLSDAGAGVGLMDMTPALDAEIIASGYHLTEIPGITAQPFLSSGAVSPAVLVHGLLKAFQQRGHLVQMKVYSFALDHLPQIADYQLDGYQHWFCQSENIEDFVQTLLLKELRQEADQQSISIVGECGVGGTTFSTLWLNLLFNQQFPPVGSTAKAEKLQRKLALINQLQQQFVTENSSLTSTDQLLSSSNYHDHFQRVVLAMAKNLADFPLSFEPLKHKAILAGGLMYLAPILAALKLNEISKEALVDQLEQWTTRWIYQGVDSHLSIEKDIQPSLAVKTHQTNFSLSRHQSIRLYEQGQVVEGCGLGGCLVLAEQLGMTEAEIIQVLDNTVDQWQKQFC